MSGLNNLKHLVLENLSWLGDEGLQAIAKLEVIKTLKTLHVNGMSITVEGMRAIMRETRQIEQFGATQLYQIYEEDWAELVLLCPSIKRIKILVRH
jgi:hypothetical protein